MQKMKKWLGRRFGSTESINRIGSAGYNPAYHPPTKTEYEVNSIKIKQMIERKSFQKVVDTLREQPSTFVLKCLESFPFKALNKAVPDTFPIWETLLTKLHNSEDGYIPEFPYNACDELVLRIAWLIETRDERSQEGQDLVVSCKRVLKCVYMQYNGVLEHLYKEYERVQHAQYTLGLHLPLGTDARTALSLQQAIKNEVTGCVVDFNDIQERLKEIEEKEEFTIGEILREGKVENPSGSDEDSGDDGLTMRYQDFPQATNPNQIQLQERLYQNQCILTCLKPSRRTGSLPELMEILNERIRGDKEVLAVFGSVRQRNGGLSDDEMIEPWLRRHQHSIECIIGIVKEIEKELEIKIIKSESPAQLQPRHKEPNGYLDEDPQIVPFSNGRPHSRNHEHSPLFRRRHSAAIVEQYPWEEDSEVPGGPMERTDRNRLSVHNPRPRSASPSKILRANGGPPVRSPSSKSMSSSNGSANDLMATVQASSSIGDLNSTKEPPLAFTRVQSLKSNHSVQLAGKRRKSKTYRNSLSSLSGSKSTGNMSGKKQKDLSRSGSGGMGSGSGGVPMWDRQLSGDSQQHMSHYSLLQKDLETKTRELLIANTHIYELRRNVRELTDRLSDQAQRHLQDSEKFEDILLGPNRPTLVVERYRELHTQGRVEVLHSIESEVLEENNQEGDSVFAIQMVLDVLEFAYAVSCSHLEQLRRDWRSTLSVSVETEDSVAVRQLESAISLYIRRVCSTKDVSDIVMRVVELLEEKYGSYPVFTRAKDLDPMLSYITECSKVSWDLCVQAPTMVIDSSEKEYNYDLHSRFYNSDKDSCHILYYHWPTLLQSSPAGVVLFKGVVQT